MTMSTEPKSIQAETLPEQMTYKQICQYWAMSDHWPLDDAIRLVLGHPPRLHHPDPLDAAAEGQIRLVKQLAINCFGASLQPVAAETHDGEVHLKPVEFVKWAAKRVENVPAALTEALAKSDFFGLGWEPPELRDVQRHRERCCGIAALLWEKNPKLTKRQVAEDPAIQKWGCEGEGYTIKKIQEWIAKENPDPSPGRPRKKSTS